MYKEEKNIEDYYFLHIVMREKKTSDFWRLLKLFFQSLW